MDIVQGSAVCITSRAARHWWSTWAARRPSLWCLRVTCAAGALVAGYLLVACCGVPPASVSTSHRRGRHQFLPPRRWDDPPERYEVVVCTLVKNEAAYIREWVEFHAGLQGVARLVVYDDNSTDHTLAVLLPYVLAGVVDLVRYPPARCTHPAPAVRAACDACRSGDGRDGLHTQATCQDAAFTDCAARYHQSATWIAVFDVDEFVFPCYNASRSLRQSLRIHQTLDRTRITMECLKFGTSGFRKRMDSSNLLLDTHVYRAPYAHLGEPEDEIKRHLLANACAKAYSVHGVSTPVCESSGGYKNIGQSQYVRPSSVSTHGMDVFSGSKYSSNTRSSSAAAISGGASRVLGLEEICCNHYAYKSDAEMLEKSRKNHNPHIEAQLRSAVPYYNQILDTQILRFAGPLKDRLMTSMHRPTYDA